MRTFRRVVLAFLAGSIASCAVTIAGLQWLIETNRILDPDNLLSLAVKYIVGPLAGLIGGVVCAIIAPIWLAGRDRNAKRPA